MVLIADSNGFDIDEDGAVIPEIDTDTDTYEWGGNHQGAGGNVVKVAGNGFWINSTNNPGDTCITNRKYAETFNTNSSGIVVYKH
jgi:alpha-tubulin suppressor-like RCC1 family protein